MGQRPAFFALVNRLPYFLTWSAKLRGVGTAWRTTVIIIPTRSLFTAGHACVVRFHVRKMSWRIMPAKCRACSGRRLVFAVLSLIQHLPLTDCPMSLGRVGGLMESVLTCDAFLRG